MVFQKNIPGSLQMNSTENSSLKFNLKEYMGSAFEIEENQPKYFASANLKVKQQLIGSVCPEKLIFENKVYRTSRINEVLALICSAGKSFSGSKKRLAPVFGSQSNKVPTKGAFLVYSGIYYLTLLYSETIIWLEL